MQELTGKVALITGAASGIGRGLVDAVVAAGMAVVATDIDAEAVALLDGELARSTTRRLVCALDIRDRAAWGQLIARVETELGPVQLLCNNAGVTATPGPMLNLSPEAWDWVVGINLTGCFNGTWSVARRLAALQLPGHIVNIASIQGLVAAAGFAPYNATKFAIVGLSETLRSELAPLDIGVSVVCPGPTRGRLMANSAKIAPQFAQNLGPPRLGFTTYQTAAQVAAKILVAVRSNRLYVLTHPEYAPILEARSAALLAALGSADAAALANLREVEAAMLKMYEDLR